MAENDQNPKTAHITDSEAKHRDDVRRAVAAGESSRIVTPQVLKEAKIRAWRHQYREEYVQHLIRVVYGRE